ncbi:MAG TPA: hypothetical protein VMU59_13220 [Caulobacteraceae bacterium]|nr:hypothetical protein [Caulobacteraceae bacterium]
MKRRSKAGRPWRAIGMGLACVAAGAGGALAQQSAFTVSPADQARLGVQTATLPRQRRSGQIDAFAKVLDPGPLAQLESDLAAAEATAAASKAEAERVAVLRAANAGVADKDVEAAKAQAGADAAHLTILRQRVGLEWGPGVERLPPAKRAALLAALAHGQAALVHVDTPSNEGQAGARTVDIDVGDGSVHGVVLGAARQAEPRLQSSGLIVEVTGKSAILLSIGLTQSAHINTASSIFGVVVPRSAVIRYEGSDWAYVRAGPGRFERRLMADAAPVDKGLFVANGVGPQDQVVVRGASELFALERAQSTKQP